MALTTTNAGGLVAGAKQAAPAAAPVAVLLLRGAYVAGVAHPAGAVIEVAPDLALLLVTSNKATRTLPAKAARAPRAPAAVVAAAPAAPPASTDSQEN